MTSISSHVSSAELMDGTQTRKRPRPVVSCLRCREKKLKCDRIVPCENCTKYGCPSDCTYNQSPASLDALPKAKRVQLDSEAVNQHPDPRVEPGRNAGFGIIEDLQLRLAKLEELLSIKPPANLGSLRDVLIRDSSSPQSSAVTQSLSSPPFLGTLVLKGTRTIYHGQNNRITLLNQFSEAKEFIDQCNKDPTIVGLVKEVQFLQSKFQLPLSSPQSISDLERSPELQQLRACLPPKGVCDQLLELYTLNFEKTLRILHVSTFIRQYNEFWADPDSEIYRSGGFLPQLTAVLAVALPLKDQSFKTQHTPLWEYLHMPAVNFVRLWLRKLGHKERTEIATVQIEALILLARRLRLVSPEELWRETGTLVRSAMVMGLHLNLEYAGLSAYQIEQRRRLWITIVEMDLQASIASGMPVTIPEIDFGPLAPANLNDTDFDELTVELPPSKNLHEWTDSLAQVTLAMSLPDRIRAMTLVRTVNSGMDLSKIVKQGRRLEECLRLIPPPLKLEQAPMSGDDPTMLLNRVLLDVYIRRPLLCLYRPIVMGKSRDDRAFFEIQQSCLESSLAILSYQDYFDPSVADLDVFNSISYWDIFQLFCKNDILWAALSVCGYMKLSTQQQSTALSPPPQPQPGSSPTPRAATHTKGSLTRIVDNTLDGLTRRIGETGSNLKDVLLLAVVLQSVRACGLGQMKERWMQQGATKALTACRQHLLLAVADQSFAFDLAESAQMLQSTQSMFPSTDPQFTPTSQSQLPDFLAESSTLATEFNNFQGDPFTFEDGSFAWNI